EAGMERYRLDVGSSHGVKAGNIVGAIANEAGLDSEFIGRVDIQADYSTVDLPEGMPKHIFDDLNKVWVCGQPMNISRMAGSKASGPKGRKRPPPRTGRAGPGSRRSSESRDGRHPPRHSLGKRKPKDK
ncbi:MAG: DbpA RNA binding domain-containing protein, partial [Mariprofundaceae bacterium]|nr:DbpA RNA binding domain-containing protein [Mariprofundaceae bacterium]